MPRVTTGDLGVETQEGLGAHSTSRKHMILLEDCRAEKKTKAVVMGERQMTSANRKMQVLTFSAFQHFPSSFTFTFTKTVL